MKMISLDSAEAVLEQERSELKQGAKKVTSIAGNMLCTHMLTTAQQGTAASFDTLVLVLDGEYVCVAGASSLAPLMAYVRATEHLDTAPFVTLTYVGEDVPSAMPNYLREGYLRVRPRLKRIAWEFDGRRDKRKSELLPKCPEGTPPPKAGGPDHG